MVIGIIALLISVLLPALSTARQSANSLKCLSNLRQIGLSLQMYMNANNGRLMPLQYSGGSYYNSTWPAILVSQKYLKAPLDGTPGGAFVCPNATNDAGSTSFSYIPPTRVSEVGYALFGGANAPETIACNYAVNGVNSSGKDWWSPTSDPRPYSEWFPFVFSAVTPVGGASQPQAHNLAKAKNAVRIPLVFDGFWCHALSPQKFTLRHGKTNNGRENDRKSNLVFLDGHADSLGGGELPATGDSLYDKAVLNSDNNGKYAITMIVKKVP